MKSRGDPAPRGRLRDAAGLLPWLGGLAVATPLPQLFADAAPSSTLVWWVFGAWAVLIVAAAVLSASIGGAAGEEPPQGDADGAPATEKRR